MHPQGSRKPQRKVGLQFLNLFIIYSIKIGHYVFKFIQSILQLNQYTHYIFTSTHDIFQGQNLIMSSSMINVGRYWPYVGPQVRLYVPKPFLAPSPTINYIIMFELEQAPCDTADKCTVEFVDQALINATPHKPNFEREETVFSRKRISV